MWNVTIDLLNNSPNLLAVLKYFEETTVSPKKTRYWTTELIYADRKYANFGMFEILFDCSIDISAQSVHAYGIHILYTDVRKHAA